jgi:hypothetical protein
MFKKIIAWLVFSSANADKISLTIKSMLYALIPVALLVLGAYKIQVESAYLSAIIDQIIAVIIVVGGTVTAITAAWGALRKIFTTATGTNAVINSFK